MRLSLTLLSLAVLLFLALNLPHLLEFTPVWPDEASIGDVALNILKIGKPSTELWGELVPGVKHYVFWYPPVFLYLLSFWFKVFGFSIINQRLLSIVVNILFIIIFSTFLKLIIIRESDKLSKIKVSMFVFLGSLCLIIDPTFLKSSVISRPEILILVLVVSSAVFILKASEPGISLKLKTRLLIIGGLLIGIVPMVHFLGGIFVVTLTLFLVISSKRFFMEKNFYLFIVAAMLPSLIWLPTILPNLDLLWKQLDVEAQGRNMTPGWLNLLFSSFPSVLYRSTFLIYSIIALIFIVILCLIKKTHWLLIGLILGASWIYAYLGKIEWYSVYIIPFTYIALILLLVYSVSNKKNPLLKDLKISVILILIILSILGINNFLKIVSDNADNSYSEFAEKVKSVIPPGKTVLLSSIPDIYHAFKSGEEYKLYEFPQVKTNQDDFKNLLGSLDYVVINSPFSNMFVGNLLDAYLQENTINKYTINAGGYNVFVYKLKHKD